MFQAHDVSLYGQSIICSLSNALHTKTQLNMARNLLCFFVDVGGGLFVSVLFLFCLILFYFFTLEYSAKADIFCSLIVALLPATRAMYRLVLSR